VRLHFAEIYGMAYGQRIFDVRINGTPVLLSFDLLHPNNAGAQFKAHVREFSFQPNANNQIIVQIVPLQSPVDGLFRGILNGLQVIPQ